MKKDVLFVINNLNCGGAEKALISLLENLDFTKYNVDLYLFKKEGMFLKDIPKQVNLLNEDKNYKYFDMSTKKAILELIKMGKIHIALSRLLSLKVFKRSDNNAIVEQKMWKYLRVTLKKLEKEYDVAIGYLENTPIYFCIDRVKAKKKIGWIHTNYEKMGMDKKIDSKYFNKLDYIFTVSHECSNILKVTFPEYKKKFKVMHNIVSGKMIRKLALENVEDVKFNNDDINIISVGRLNYQKGFEIAIKACNVLINSGYKIKWNIIGEGEERIKLEELINKYNIKSSFRLLGLKENPYKYIQKSDIYVQPSRVEGKSIAIDEAKILCKPIVVTNFDTAKDQIEENINGIIAELDYKSLAEKIEKVINDDKLRNRLKINLESQYISNENEISKLYKVLE